MNFKKVLIVDDDEDYQKIYEQFFEDLGVPYTQVFSGKEALDSLKDGKHAEYSLLILDLYLPGMDGLAVAKEVKKSYPVIKICCITANVHLFNKAELLKSGVHYFVKKPFNIQDITSLIDQGIELQL